MSILIKGMKMPKNCCECWFMEGADEWCCAHRGRYLKPDYRNAIKDKPDWCPLVELPPHGRLIEKNAVFELIQSMPSVDKLLPVEFMKALQEIPTIIPAEEGE